MFIFLFILPLKTISQILLKETFEGSCVNVNKSSQLDLNIVDINNNVAFWLRLFNPQSGINQQQIATFNKSTMSAILQLRGQQNSSLNFSLLMNLSTILTQISTKSAIITNTTYLNYMEWNFITINYLGGSIWFPRTNQNQSFMIDNITISKQFSLILGYSDIYLNGTIVTGLCGNIRMVSTSPNSLQPFSGPGNLIFALSFVTADKLFKSQIDKLVHLYEPNQRNVTMLDGVAKVRGAIPYSIHGVIQATISFFVYINSSSLSQIELFRHFRAHYQQIAIRAQVQGSQYVLKSCYQESKAVECQLHLDLKIPKKQWTQVIGRVYESTPQSLDASFELTVIQSNNQVITQTKQYSIEQSLRFQAGDTILIGSSQVSISNLKVYNTIDVDTQNQSCMAINVGNQQQCLVTSNDQQQPICRPICNTCYSYDVCITCAGNRINPPECDCPQGTYFNDIKGDCEAYRWSDIVQTGIFDLNQEVPNHNLRYLCSRDIQCSSNTKQLPVEITFQWPFPYYLSTDKLRLELVVSVLSFRFLTNMIDFNIQENYIHLGAFKITIQVDPQAQLEQLVLSWVVFIPHNDQYQSFMRASDQYIFSDSIQTAKIEAQTAKLTIASYASAKQSIKIYFQGTKEQLSEKTTTPIIMLNQVSKCRNCLVLNNNSYNLYIKPSLQLFDDGNFIFSVDYSSGFVPELMKFTILLINSSLMNVTFVDLNSKSQTNIKSDNSVDYGFYQYNMNFRSLFTAITQFNLVNTKENNTVTSLSSPPGYDVLIDDKVTIQTYGSQLNQMQLAFINFSTPCAKVINQSICQNCNQLNNLCFMCLDKLKIAPQCQDCSPGSGFLNDTSNICGRCDGHCISCTTVNQCTECKQQFQYAPSCQQCIEVRQYDDRDPINPQCWPCPKNCFTCFDNKTCLSCPNEPLVLLGDDNQCKQCGLLGYYYVDGQCKKCDPECYSCADTADNCLVCKVGRSIKSDCLCDDGYYFYNNECSKCHPTCATCTGGSMYSCLTCSTKLRRIFEINKQASTRKCVCAPRYYNNYLQLAQVEPDFLYQCNPCYAFCYRCSGPAPNQCTSCLDNDKRIFSKGECNCTDGYFNNPVQQCQPCYESCRQCLDENKDKCTSCYMRPSNSTLYNYEASMYLFTQTDQYGYCMSVCPGPKYWGEPTLATCRHQVCGARYNPSLRQCCYIPTDDCFDPYAWNPMIDQKNNSRLYLDFTGEMAINKPLQKLLLKGMNFKIIGLDPGIDYSTKIYSDDIKPLKPNVKSYCPKETLKNYTFLASQFIVEITYSQPIMGANVQLKLDIQKIQDPYGVIVKLPSDKKGGFQFKIPMYQPDPSSIIEKARDSKKLLEITSYIIAWLIFLQIFIFKSYALDTLFDVFQETYFIGFLSMNLPQSASIILTGLKPFFFQFNIFEVKEYRGNFWFEPFGYNVTITQLYGLKSNSLQNMEQPINFFVNMGLDMMIIMSMQTSRGFINSWLRDDTFKGRTKSFFEHLQAYIYLFMAKFFYIKFNYLLMSSLLVLGQYYEPNGDNINEYYVAFVFLTYTMIVIGRYIQNINDPDRGLKCQPQLKQFFYPMNEMLWIQSPYKRNLYSVAMMRKLAITFSVFMLPYSHQVTTQIGLVISIYCLEIVYLFGVWWQANKVKFDCKNYQPIRYLIIQVVLTCAKLINYLLVISIIRLDLDIQSTTNQKQFVSPSKVSEKSDQAYNMIVGAVVICYIFGFAAYLVQNLFDESLFKSIQAKLGDTIFQNKTQLYHDHQELKMVLKEFRSTVQADKDILQFKNFFEQSYEILPLFQLQQMLSSKLKRIKLDTINYKRKNLEFYSESYQIIDVFKYKDFIIIVNNLEARESGTVNFSYNTNPMTVWIYHPAYQVTYISEDTSPKYLTKKYRYLPEERHPQLNDDILNFATHTQIEYAYHSSFKIESCEVQVGTNVPDMLFRTLFDHESIFLKEDLSPFDECQCDQCYYLKEWTRQEKIKRIANRKSQIEPLRPWNKYDQFDAYMVDVNRLTRVIKQSDTKTKVINFKDYQSYENMRLTNKFNKVMEDVSNLRKNYESESSDTDDQLRELFGKLIKPDGAVNDLELEKYLQEDDSVPLLSPNFQSNLFVLRLKVLQFK